MPTNRNTYFSKKVILLNTIATVMIVLLHSETPLRWGQQLDFKTYPFIWAVFTLTQFAVPLFFFISALLFYRDCEWRDIPAKLYRRLFSLLIPFILWNTLFVTVYWALSRIPFSAGKMALATPLDTSQQWISAIWHTRFTPLWFVKYLIYFCLLSPLILLLIKNRWVGIAASIGVLAISIACKWESMTQLFYWLPIYLAGAITGRYLYGPGNDGKYPLFRSISSGKRSAIVVASATVLMAIYVWGLFDETSWVFGRYFGPIIIWFLADLLLPAHFGETFTVRRWMSYTFFIFATHHFLLNVEQALARTYFPATPLVLNLTFVITPVITLFIIILTANFLSRFRIYKLLTGGR